MANVERGVWDEWWEVVGKLWIVSGGGIRGHTVGGYGRASVWRMAVSEQGRVSDGQQTGGS